MFAKLPIMCQAHSRYWEHSSGQIPASDPMVVRAKKESETRQERLGCTVPVVWEGLSITVVSEQEPKKSEGVSHMTWGFRKAFQNKNHEAAECIMCSKKRKDQCCWERKVVKDVRAQKGGWGSGVGVRSSIVSEDTLRACDFTPLGEAMRGFSVRVIGDQLGCSCNNLGEKEWCLDKAGNRGGGKNHLALDAVFRSQKNVRS